MLPAEVVCVLQMIKEEAQETLMGYITIGIIIFIVIVIIILLAFHQVDMGIDLSWNASTKRGQITAKSCSWVEIEFEFRFYNLLVICLRIGN